MIEISVVTPVLNEEETILKFIEKLNLTLLNLNKNYEIIFVLDPCSDKTEDLILNEAKKNKNIKLITLSRKFGQPAATLAGLGFAKGEYVVVIDADLQDPPELIKDLYEKIKSGYDVIYAEREKRHGESIIKKLSQVLVTKLSIILVKLIFQPMWVILE